MSDWTFYGTAALIGLVGGLVSQVLTLQQSLQIRAQTANLEKKRGYYRLVIKSLAEQRDKFQNHMWELEEKISTARDTPEDKTETQYKQFYKNAEKQRDEMVTAITEWDKRRNDLVNELHSIQKTYFVSPWFLIVLNVIVGALVAWLFGFVEVSTRGSGQAKLTANLVIEFLFAGAFWPLIWQRVFNTGAVKERVTAAVAKFGVDATASITPAGVQSQ